jgi:hypothetical protein
MAGQVGDGGANGQEPNQDSAPDHAVIILQVAPGLATGQSA